MYKSESYSVVTDPSLLGRLLRETVGRHRTQIEAAKVLGISQPHFHRLSSGDPAKVGRRMTVELRRAIEREIPPDRRDELWNVFMSPKAEALHKKHMAWIWKSIEPFTNQDYSSLLCTPPIPWETPPVPQDSNQFKYLEMWSFICSQDSYREVVLKWCRRTGEDLGGGVIGYGGPRIRVAFVRVLEPLLAADASGGIERSIKEMHESGELLEYLTAAFKSEEILLRRSRGMERVKNVLDGATAVRREVKKCPACSLGRLSTLPDGTVDCDSCQYTRQGPEP